VWARWVLAIYVVGFADGTGAHVIALARGGLHAYSSFHQVPFQVFFVALVALDPLAAVLVAFVLPEGLWLAAGVMALDLAANWAGNWPWPSHYLQLWPMTAFGVFVLVSAPFLLRALSPRHGPARTP
jgi:hypothetical protein